MSTLVEIDRRISEKFSEVIRTREDMHGYQGTAVEFGFENPFAMMMIDLGLGKTVSSLTIIADLIAAFACNRVLVIGPLKVVTDTWPTEIGLWNHTAWLSWTLLREQDDDPRFKEARRRAREFGRSEGLSVEECAAMANRAETAERQRIRKELARSKTSIHIINRENVEWLVNLHGKNWPYDFVIIDESSSFKDHRTERFKALAKIRRLPGAINRMILLTATPAAETYEHLFGQIYLLDLGERLGKNITTYRDTYFSYNKYSQRYKLLPGMEERILEKIADICLVMKKQDYLPRTEPTVIRRMVKLAPAEKGKIAELEKEFVITLDDGTEIEAKTAAMLSSMLLQLASGSLYETVRVEDFDTGDLKKVKKVHNVHSHKIEVLREIYEEAQTQGEPLLVAYFFQSTLARLRKAFPKATVMDKEGKCIKAWNQRKIPMLFIHPQSAGHGLNLQHGGSTLVFFDMIYSLEYYQQTVGRLDRQGQKNPVVVQLLVAEGTRDVVVADTLAQKEDAQERLFVILKRLIRKYRKACEMPVTIGNDDL